MSDAAACVEGVFDPLAYGVAQAVGGAVGRERVVEVWPQRGGDHLELPQAANTCSGDSGRRRMPRSASFSP
jgi:hypothetical protein